MINSQMDNPFSVGDLVHIPKGVLLYDDRGGNQTQSYFPLPEKAIEKPSVGLILNKPFPEFYRVSIGPEEYLIRKEDMMLVTRKGMR